MNEEIKSVQGKNVFEIHDGSINASKYVIVYS